MTDIVNPKTNPHEAANRLLLSLSEPVILPLALTESQSQLFMKKFLMRLSE